MEQWPDAWNSAGEQDQNAPRELLDWALAKVLEQHHEALELMAADD